MAERLSRLLGSRGRRTIALGAGVVLLCWLGLRVIPAAAGRVRNANEMLETRRALLERLETELAGLEVLADTTKALQARVIGLAPRILSGTGGAEALNNLVGRVTLAKDRGLTKLTRTDPVPDSVVAGRLGRVALRVGFEGDIRAVVGTIRALEDDPAALVLDDLRVMALDPQSGQDVAEVLRVELTVRGWHQMKAEGT